MPDFLWTASGDISPAGDVAVEALLTGKLPPENAADDLRPLAEAIAALTMPPMPSEIEAEPDAREAYRAAFGRSANPGARRRRRTRRPRPALAALIPVRLAAATVLLLGLLAAGAYTGVLPAPAQRFAHDTFGAPAPHPVPQSTPPGPPGAPARTPPGQGRKTPPGQVGKTPPGQVGKTPPGQVGRTPPGQVGRTPPGQVGKTPHGHSASHHQARPRGPG